MVRLTLRSKVLVIMAIPVAVLVAATFALLAASRDSADALIAERQAASLRGAYEDVLVDMTDAESATRGYVLTGERLFLEPYDLAVERLPAHMRTLTELTRDSASAAAGGGRAPSARQPASLAPADHAALGTDQRRPRTTISSSG